MTSKQGQKDIMEAPLMSDEMNIVVDSNELRLVKQVIPEAYTEALISLIGIQSAEPTNYNAIHEAEEALRAASYVELEL